MNIADRWRDFWFTETPPHALAATRAGFFAILFVLAAREPLAAKLAEFPVSFWRPVWVIAQVTHGPPAYTALHVLELVWHLTLLTSALGLATRVSTIAASGFTLYFLGLLNSFGTVSHGRTPVALATIVFALAACGDAWSVDALLKRTPAKSPRYRWPLQLLRVVWCSTFFAAGVSKLVESGFAWAFSDNLATMLLAAPHRYPEVAAAMPAFGVWIAHHPALCVALALATLTLELATPLALLGGRWAQVTVTLIAVLQVGIYLTMFENFVWLMPLYVVWLAMSGSPGAQRRVFV